MVQRTTTTRGSWFRSKPSSITTRVIDRRFQNILIFVLCMRGAVAFPTSQVKLAISSSILPTFWPLVVHRSFHSRSYGNNDSSSSIMAVINPFGIEPPRRRSRNRSRSISTVPDSEPERQEYFQAQKEKRQQKKREKSQSVVHVVDDDEPVPSSSKVTLDHERPTMAANDIITIDESESEIGEQPQGRVDLSRYKYNASSILKAPTSRANLSASTLRAKSALPAVGAIRQYVKKAKGKGNAVELPSCPLDEKLIKQLGSCVVCGDEWPTRKMVKTKWVS